MTLRPPASYTIPEETARIARAAFPQGTLALRLADELGRLVTDQDFAALYPTHGQPGLAPAQLALVTVLQFVEGLSDRQAADAVRGRIDWKYVLCLALDDPGFHYSVLSEFRERLLAGEQEALLFEAILTRCREARLLRARGQQRTDSTAVVAAVRTLNRLELVGETVRHALQVLATAAPAWLRPHLAADWVQRYGPRVEDYRLPQAKAARAVLAGQIGADGRALLAALDAAEAPAWLRELPAVVTLRQVWDQHYEEAGTPGQLRWRGSSTLPPSAERIASPYDPDAHVGSKRETSWLGYKVQCDSFPRNRPAMGGG